MINLALNSSVFGNVIKTIHALFYFFYFLFFYLFIFIFLIIIIFYLHHVNIRDELSRLLSTSFSLSLFLEYPTIR